MYVYSMLYTMQIHLWKTVLLESIETWSLLGKLGVYSGNLEFTRKLGVYSGNLEFNRKFGVHSETWSLLWNLFTRKLGVYYKTRSLFESLHICDVPYTKYCSKTMSFITKYCQVQHSAHSALCTTNLTYYSKWSTSCKQCYFLWIHGKKIIKILYKCCRNHRLLF